MGWCTTHPQHHPLNSTLFVLSENTANLRTMSTPPSPTDSPITNSSNNHPLDLFAPELSNIVLDPEMIGPIRDAFTDDPAGSILIRYYQHLSLSIARTIDTLDRHYEDRNNVFQFAITNQGFRQRIQPVLRTYRRMRRRSSSPYQRPQSRISTPSDDLSYEPPTDDSNQPPPSDTHSIPVLPQPSDTPSSSYATALEDESGTPTTQVDWTQHEGKTLQQLIEEGIGSSRQRPIDIDQFDNGPGSSQINPINVDDPTGIPNLYALRILPQRSDDSLAKAMGRNRRWPKNTPKPE